MPDPLLHLGIELSIENWPSVEEAARNAGADFVQLALTHAELDSLDAAGRERIAAQSQVGIRIDALFVGGLTRLAEIYTHPASRAATLRRLNAAMETATDLGVRRLILGTKEVVPAEVAIPAYRVALREVAEQAERNGILLALEPVEGWSTEEASELLRGLSGMPMKLSFSLPNAHRAGESPVDSLSGLQEAPISLRISDSDEREEIISQLQSVATIKKWEEIPYVLDIGMGSSLKSVGNKPL